LVYLVFLIIVLISCFRTGYQFGTLDHVILSLRGISKADPEAFVNDFFVTNSPQPHWLFDLFTQLGEKLNMLREFYFCYWVLSSAIFSWAFVLICRHLKIEKYSWVIAIFLLMGPIRFLGTGSLYGSWALPHFLGGSLALLTLAFWLNGKDFWLWLLVPLTTLVHTQHGALLSLLLVGACLLQARDRWKVILLGFLNLSIVFLTARMRGLTDAGELFLKLCKEIIPGHCYAPMWPVELLLPLVPMVMALVFSSISLWWNRKNIWHALLIISTVVTIFGTLSDYFDIEPIASIFRRLFMHRLASFSMVLSIITLCYFILFPVGRTYLKWISRSVAILALAFSWAFDSSIFKEEKFIVTAGENALYIERAGKVMQAIIPVGETITMNPGLEWVRYATRRAVVADTKAVPHQEKAYQEWEERFKDIGGRNFESLDFKTLVRSMKKYNSHFVLISDTDVKAPQAAKTFKQVGIFFGQYKLYWADEATLSLHL